MLELQSGFSETAAHFHFQTHRLQIDNSKLRFFIQEQQNCEKNQNHEHSEFRKNAILYCTLAVSKHSKQASFGTALSCCWGGGKQQRNPQNHTMARDGSDSYLTM